MANQNQNQQQLLLSLPNSLHQQIQRAQNLLDQSEEAVSGGDLALAQEKAREGMRVLQIVAQTDPEIGALVFAGMMGYGGYEVEIVERVDDHQLVERKFFGLSMGHEVVNVPNVKRRFVRGRLL
ncbi:MAG: hypothetical protein ACR2HJ_07795 [Fimbriimonadales bacterium]